MIITTTKKAIVNKHIFPATRKDLGVGAWGLKNPYGVRISNSLEIIGRSLNNIQFYLLKNVV